MDLSKSLTSRDRHFTHGRQELRYSAEGGGGGGGRLMDQDRKIKCFRQRNGEEENTPHRWRGVSPADRICQSRAQRCLINSHGARTNGPSVPPSGNKKGTKAHSLRFERNGGKRLLLDRACVVLRGKVRLGTCCLRPDGSNSTASKM